MALPPADLTTLLAKLAAASVDFNLTAPDVRPRPSLHTSRPTARINARALLFFTTPGFMR